MTPLSRKPWSTRSSSTRGATAGQRPWCYRKQFCRFAAARAGGAGRDSRSRFCCVQLPQQFAAMQAQLAVMQAQAAAQFAAVQAQTAAQFAAVQAQNAAQFAAVQAVLGPIALSAAVSYNAWARVRNSGGAGDIVWLQLVQGAVGTVPDVAAAGHPAAFAIRTFASLATANLARVTFYVNFYGLGAVASVAAGRLALQAFL